MRDEADFRIRWYMNWSMSVRIQVLCVSLHSTLLLLVLAPEWGRTVHEDYPQLLLLGHLSDVGHMLIFQPIPGKKDGTIFKLGFLNFDTIDIWGWAKLCCGGCAVHCRMLSNILGLGPKMPIAPSPQVWQSKMSTWICLNICFQLLWVHSLGWNYGSM